MKRIILIISILANCSTLFASDLHLNRMINAINKGEFEKAAKEITKVNNWDLSQKIVLDINNAYSFLNYANTIEIPNSSFDSICMYIARESFCASEYYADEGMNNDALYYIELYLEITNVVLEGKHPYYAYALENAGNLCDQIGDYTKANQYYIQALEIIKNTSGENHPDYAGSLNNLGNSYNEMGEYTLAEQYYQQALEIRKNVLGVNHPDYAVSLSSLGTLYWQMGDYAKSEFYLLQALDLKKSISGDKSINYAVTLHNLGVLYGDIGDYEKAEKCFIESLHIKKNVLGEMHPDYASTLGMMGILYSHKGDYILAEHYCIQALEIEKSTYGTLHPDYALQLNNLGAIYSDIGDYEKAEKCYLESLRIKKNVLGEMHPDYASALRNIGLLYGDKGDFIKAEQYILQAFNIQKGIMSEDNPNYIASLLTLGCFYNYIGDFEKAYHFFAERQAKEIAYYMNSLNFMSEKQRKLYLTTMRSTFDETYTAFVYHYSVYNPKISTFAYDNELFTKGILLASTDNIRRSILDSGDTTLIMQWDEFVVKKQQIAKIEEKNPQSEYIGQLKEDAEFLEKQITRNSAAYRQSKEQWNITWDSIRNHLNKEQVAIEYMVAPLNEDSTMCCALLLRNNSQYPELIPLFEEKEVLSLVNTTTENQTSHTYSIDGNGEQLSNLIWSKVLPHIKQGETIYFAPSGLLHQIAIEALPYDESHTMADMYNLVRLSSTREIVLNKSSDTHTTAALYGGIQYDMSGDEILAESEMYSSSTLLASRGIENDTLDRGSIKYLPGTKKEVESINQMLKDNKLSVQLFTTTNANEESFKALSGTHQNILHIATHGFYWSDSTAHKKDYFSQRMLVMDDKMLSQPTIDPLNRCGLLFAGANTALSGHSADLPEGVQDGILTAKEISLLDLRDADLVILSACETGKGEVTGEGVFGLQRAFKQAGAQTIIMSLWPVNDAATQLLMTEFYRNWITNHQSKREAFRNAQNTVRSQYEEPVYWAGFIMLD